MLSHGVHPIFFLGQTGCRRLKADANALLAVECCIENNRRSEIIDWRDFRSVAAEPRKMRRARRTDGGTLASIYLAARARQVSERSRCAFQHPMPVVDRNETSSERRNIQADLSALDMFEIRAREVNCAAAAYRGRHREGRRRKHDIVAELQNG